MRKLTVGQKRDIKAIAAKRDEDIDFSDAPPVPDWSQAKSASSTGQKRLLPGKPTLSPYLSGFLRSAACPPTFAATTACPLLPRMLCST